MSNSNFLVSQEDWSLHRKGHEDQKRHEEKIQEALKGRLDELITNEQIVMADKENNIIKIPVKSLNEYKIIYNHNKMQHTGMGNGGSQVGDTVARGDSDGQTGSANGGSGSEEAGEDYYEASIDVHEIQKALFEELELPFLEKKQAGIMEATDYEWNDIRKVGITGNIHKKKTLLQAFKRNALKGEPSFYPVIPEDLRYRSFNEIKKPDTRAVILAMMDTSGSMGIWEKYMARSVFHWIKGFLETKYESVEIVYIAHHTEAKEVNEYEFFHKGEAGGTICSSAYRHALKLIEEKYPPSQYNIYAYHASDGDNLTSDNARCVHLIEKLCTKVNFFGYIEANQYNRHSTLMSAYKNIRNKKFTYYVLKQRADVLSTLKSFFRKREKANAGF